MKSILAILLNVDNPLSEGIRLLLLIGFAFYAGEWHAWGYSWAWKGVTLAVAAFVAIHMVQYFKSWSASKPAVDAIEDPSAF